MVLPHEKPLVAVNARRITGGSAGEGTFGDDYVDRPPDMPTKDEADHVVTNIREMRRAATDENASIYYDAHVNVTDGEPIWLAGNNTVVGQYCDPTVPSTGNWIHYDEIPTGGYTGVFRQSSGVPPTFYGVYLLGPLRSFTDYDHTAPDFEDKLRSGVWISTKHDEGTATFIGCRFTGWTWSGAQMGWHDSVTDAKFYRCTFHMNNFNHYGYGMCTYKGDIWLDYCFFDDNRHHTAGWGYPEETHDITNSVGGPGPGASHSWDMHGTEINGERVAGGHVRMRRCTTLQNRSIWGGYQEATKYRGVPDELSWSEDCAYPDARPPQKDNPNRKQAIRQETGEWINVNPFDHPDKRGGNNYYGPLSGIPDGIGAPTADDTVTDDITTDESLDGGTQPDRPDLEEPTRELAIVPSDNTGGNYWVWISGNARPANGAEKNDVVNDVNGHADNVLTGWVHDKWVDTFELGASATLESAWSTVPCVITIDGEPVAEQASLYAIAADRRFEHT